MGGGTNAATGGTTPGPKQPDISSLHRDLQTANAYRQEFIKSLILICGALFAFSVTFRPELKLVAREELFWTGWIALGTSMLGGFGQLAAWERFYASYQQFEWKGESGKVYREMVTLLRRCGLVAQVLGFVVGVASIGSFTAVNLANAEKAHRTGAAMADQQPITNSSVDFGLPRKTSPQRSVP